MSSGRELIEQVRTIFTIDGGSTDNVSIADVLLTVGGVIGLVLAVVVLLSLLLDNGDVARGYAATAATGHPSESSYISYEPALAVAARAFKIGFEKWEQSRESETL